MKKPTITAEQILDAALHLADVCGWERLHLFDVAAHLDTGLDAIAVHYREKDQLVEAWFDRADRALLNRAKTPDLIALEPAKRLEELLVAWFDGLAAHRAVTGQMLLYKLEPGHLHLQVLGLLRVSRTVQWWREAAQRETLHLSRIAEESLLTGVYLRSVVHWLRHPEEGPAEFRAFMRRQLRCGPLCLLLRQS
ncbi:TetR/AcrR family transcriptional regulator [Pseudomonas sp. UBA2684]|uniref:TetR/AcrR family transcriptional regulator n=1 Tax=Pseudomonas sp. UBA2684 TaxID=1947311 RepID=UPI000E97A569|nr:TetR/AcrR family transcriptional regulator [Pseudomonas sp. UBA2684]HBX55371.1 TetR family transcriptional regulator [Pseudomonas sp.]|tara:strand:+ start:15224 stop:15805 length:582 start_codon:yes stop_codon:yes gene_type:complete